MINMTLEAEELWTSLQSPMRSAEAEMEEQLAQLSPLPCKPNLNAAYSIPSQLADRDSGSLPARIENAGRAFRLQNRSSPHRPSSLPLRKPAHSIDSLLQMERYNHLISCASEKRYHVTADAEAEAALLCDALSICDEDLALHTRLAYLLLNM